MNIAYRMLIIQLYHIYKRRGLLSLLNYLLKSFEYLIINRRFRGSYSQKGEDLFINRYFNNKKKGFYVDVGACHPKRFNNTNFFYDKGWTGINIEPNPARIKLFKKDRKKDINLNVGIGIVRRTAIFYEFDSAGFSTFSQKEAKSLLKLGYKLKGKIKIPIERLDNVFKKYVKSNIEFMTVDTEGMDLDVLKSNNWNKYRPKILCIETLDFIDLLTSVKEDLSQKEEIGEYLAKNGYQELFSNGLNTIYEDVKV